MSLKFFHVVFVSCSILLLFVFGTWTLRDYLHEAAFSSLVMSLLSYLAGVVMLFYGLWFLKKVFKDNQP